MGKHVRRLLGVVLSTALFVVCCPPHVAGARLKEEHRTALRHEDSAQDRAAAKFLS